MFTDIVGFTDISQRDETLAMRLLEEHRSLLRPQFVQHNGREVKTIGDAFLVEFDSALDAARCAVDAQRILHERNTQVAGEPIELRIGIHVGDVIHQENDVYGDAVNVASRIHGLAEPGGVCLSEPVASQLRGKLGLSFEKLPPTQLKNVSQPIELYRVGLPWTEGGVALTTPWVDRDPELAVAHRLLSRSLRGEGGVLLVTGEAGVGKSRLVEETAAAAVRGGGRVLRGRCTQGELSAPYAPWAEAIRQLVRDAPPQMLYTALGSHAAEVARLVPEIVERVGPAPVGSGVDPNQALLKLLEGVVGLLTNLASEAPVVLVLDDLQWADSASTTLLLFLARRVRGHPILIVGAYREEEGDENPELREVISQLNRDRLATRLPLDRFDVERTGEMIARTFHEPETSVEFARLIFERTGGNPFFIEEVLRALVRDGTIHWTNTGWDRKPVTEIELPKALKEAISGRLRRLDEPANDLLRLASVIGYEFDFELLREVSGLEESRLLDLLEKALTSGLVRETERPGRRLVYLFTDHQIRDVVYGDLSLVRRRRLHLKVAQAMEASREAGTRERIDALAFHYLQGNDSEKALTYSIHAAENASAVFASLESYRHYRNALELAEESDDLDRRASVLMALGGAEELIGRAKSAVEHYRTAATLYETLGRRRPRGEALTNAGSAVLEHVGDLPLARQLLREAVEVLEPEGESRELAIGTVNLGYLVVQAGEPSEGRRLLRAGLPMAEAFGLANERSIALQFLAMTSPIENVSEAVEMLRQAAEIAEKANALRTSTKFTNLGGFLARTVMDFSGAWEATEHGAHEGARREADYFVRYARMAQLLILDLQGEWSRLRELARSMQEGATEEPSAFVAIGVARELARIEFRQGNRSESLRQARRALDLAEGVQATDEIAMAEQVFAWDALERGDTADSRRRLEALREKLKSGGVVANNLWEYTGVLSTLVELLLVDRDLDGARRLVSEMEGLAGRAHLPWLDTHLASAKGAIARETGDAAGAAGFYRRAAEAWEHLGVPYETGVASVKCADALEAAGRLEEAREVRGKARVTFERLGARPQLDKLRAHEAPPVAKAEGPSARSRVPDPEPPVY
jgi:predicted ATPase